MKQICFLILIVFFILSFGQCQDSQDRIDLPDSSFFTIDNGLNLAAYQYQWCDTPGCVFVTIFKGDTLLSIEGDTTRTILKLILQFFDYSNIVNHLAEAERLIQGELKKHE